MTSIHDLINAPETKVDVSGSSCITSLIDADSIIYILGWHHRDEDDTEAMTTAIDRFIHDLLVKNQARQFAGFFSDKQNFRHTLYPAYKAQRKDPHPGIAKWKPYIIEYCIQAWNFHKVEHLEADDAVACLQNNMVNTIICSPDKDLLQVPGNHYDYKKDQKIYISKEEGVYNWAYQMLVGDTTDNIKGIPMMGPIGAKRILPEPGLLTSDIAHELVKSEYYKKFNNYDEFEMHCQLIGMGHNHQPHFEALNTFDLEKTSYLSDDQGEEAEDLFGSW